MDKIRLTIILTLFFALCTAAYGQVTIGSGIAPNKGALLDIKENDEPTGGVTAKKGMMLPRVELSDLNKLYPMYENDGSGGYKIGSDNYTKADEDKKHTGLTVYNVNQCPAGKTIYDETGPQVWNGSRWQSLIAVPAIIEATPAQTSAPANAWGTNVVHHAAKPVDPMDASKGNIYEEFYSAEFGADAGRWMTTNLAAWAYDGNRHSTDPNPLDPAGTSGLGDKRTLGTLPNANSGNPYNTAYWCYPGPTGNGTSATAYTNNPHLGLLYTWDAATAGKGGDTGQKNIYSMSAANQDANNENSWPYHPDQLNGTMTSFPGNSNMGNYQWRIQGICPQGWHLPSDREWTELENAIITNTTDYASVPKNIYEKPEDLLPQNSNSTAYNRGKTHGQAMKDPCGVTDTDPKGQSKRLADNGFNVLLAGTANAGSVGHLGAAAAFWSSSSDNDSSAWDRLLANYQANVNLGWPARWNLSSVRCKKD